MTQTLSHQNNPKSGPRKLAGWGIAHPMVCVLIYIVVVSAFFLAFPRVDFFVSGLFYSETAGFWAQNDPF